MLGLGVTGCAEERREHRLRGGKLWIWLLQEGDEMFQELNFFQAHRWLHGKGRGGRDDLAVSFHSLPSSTLAANAAFYSAGLSLTIFAPQIRLWS